MSALLKRYRMFLVLSGASIALTLLAPDIGWTALSITKENTLEMLSFLPPIFILLGLLDVWIDRETMMKYMGNGSGMRGGLLAFILGSAAAGPLYAAFPMAGVLLKKGASQRHVREARENKVIHLVKAVLRHAYIAAPSHVVENIAHMRNPCKKQLRPKAGPHAIWLNPPVLAGINLCKRLENKNPFKDRGLSFRSDWRVPQG